MNLLKNYLYKIQKENIYSNPIQTRPKPEPGISKEKVKDPPAGDVGPTGLEVDLDKDEVSGYSFLDKIFKGEKGDDDEDDEDYI
jgi:hypothetical protein